MRRLLRRSTRGVSPPALLCSTHRAAANDARRWPLARCFRCASHPPLPGSNFCA